MRTLGWLRSTPGSPPLSQRQSSMGFGSAKQACDPGMMPGDVSREAKTLPDARIAATGGEEWDRAQGGLTPVVGRISLAFRRRQSALVDRH
jgi:hypothetical protein